MIRNEHDTTTNFRYHHHITHQLRDPGGSAGCASARTRACAVLFTWEFDYNITNYSFTNNNTSKNKKTRQEHNKYQTNKTFNFTPLAIHYFEQSMF